MTPATATLMFVQGGVMIALAVVVAVMEWRNRP